MRVAVLSDVHANLQALEAVLADIDRERVDAVWSLGDVVGYGPQPNRCCELVAAHADISLCGNHDLAALNLLGLEDFSSGAAAAARWTAATLSEDAREYLRTLEPTAETPQASLVHGSPRDPVWEYVLTPDAAAAALNDASRSLLLVGHSHVALALELREALEGGLAPDGTTIDLDERTRRLLNPGSVGQPRDGDPRAAWLLLDFSRGQGVFRRVRYAFDRTQAEIRAAGLPETLATRLASGS
jgi:predicted phosphodiesterase